MELERATKYPPLFLYTLSDTKTCNNAPFFYAPSDSKYPILSKSNLSSPVNEGAPRSDVRAWHLYTDLRFWCHLSRFPKPK